MQQIIDTRRKRRKRVILTTILAILAVWIVRGELAHPVGLIGYINIVLMIAVLVLYLAAYHRRR